ncbi:unnamed protein product [Heligmosomoides polygyrus]|uniref:Acyl-CoA dehydrogenase n=1 Tax=Heligmosomoides polygyrus TaxID=6339 RepID=A0A183FDM8_HELPZ|nr:unnamed protein product [Heligmosomoides polygyrus]
MIFKTLSNAKNALRCYKAPDAPPAVAQTPVDDVADEVRESFDDVADDVADNRRRRWAVGDASPKYNIGLRESAI